MLKRGSGGEIHVSISRYFCDSLILFVPFSSTGQDGDVTRKCFGEFGFGGFLLILGFL